MMDPTRNDWTFTLTYDEIRNQQQPYVQFDTTHWLQSFLSAPEESEAKSCVYMFNGLNATSSSGGLNGCDGVLDDSCTSLLRNITYAGSECRLGTQWTREISDAVRAACGEEMLVPGFLNNGKFFKHSTMLKEWRRGDTDNTPSGSLRLLK
jgi:hypothetical protein